ncbi:hypothetical protein OROMI_014710 [Orobanche minor]
MVMKAASPRESLNKVFERVGVYGFGGGGGNNHKCPYFGCSRSSWLEKKMGFLCPLGCVICLFSYAPCYIMRFLATDRSYCIQLQFIASARLMTELCGIIINLVLVADRTSGGSNRGQHRLRPRLTFKNHWRKFFSRSVYNIRVVDTKQAWFSCGNASVSRQTILCFTGRKISQGLEGDCI